jgi:hypothetical protein
VGLKGFLCWGSLVIGKIVGYLGVTHHTWFRASLNICILPSWVRALILLKVSHSDVPLLVVKALIVRKLVSVLEHPSGILFEFIWHQKEILWEFFFSYVICWKSLLNFEVWAFYLHLTHNMSYFCCYLQGQRYVNDQEDSELKCWLYASSICKCNASHFPLKSFLANLYIFHSTSLSKLMSKLSSSIG